ncbi:FAD:protein FMN transferase [Planctomycetota bacterium]
MDSKRYKILIGIIAAGCLIGAVVFLWLQANVEADSGYRVVMGTFARVVVVAKDSTAAQDCIDSAMAAIEKVDELMSDYKEDSDIGILNREGFAEVNEWTFEVLQRSVEFSRISDGSFDVTVGPLMELWRRASEANSLPSEKELAAARARVGYEKLLLDANERSVRFAVDGMKVDLGAIAKGYAIDKAVEAMRLKVAVGGMVDIGGDIRCFGKALGGRDNWMIGLQDPNLGSELMLIVKVSDAAVATSGDYQQFILIKGKRYGHIIDRSTGTSADDLSSVTIICPSATDADALATTVSVMGREKGIALIETLPEVEAILISAGPEYRITKSSGAQRYIK